MRRIAYVFVGIVLFAAAAGAFGYRMMNEPAWLERYSWIIGEENAASQRQPSSEGLRPQGGEAPSMQTQARRGDDRRTPREQLNNMKLLELGLDIANVLVGIIGIYLTLSGMRMRRQVRA